MNLMVSAVVVASILGLGACAAGESAAKIPVAEAPSFEVGTTMARLAAAGTITIGTSFDKPLFGLKNSKGDLAGFDVEIGKLIAAGLGVAPEKINWVETSATDREQFIENGTVDLVVATYGITDKRKEIVSFAGPYLYAGQDLLVAAGNPEHVTGPKDLKDKNVCDSVSPPSEKKISEFGVNLISADNFANCLKLLRSGKVIAVTGDNVALAGLVYQNDGEFEIVGNQFTEEPLGIGLAYEDNAFRSFINDVLEKSFKNGTWKAAWDATAGKVLKNSVPPVVNRY